MRATLAWVAARVPYCLFSMMMIYGVYQSATGFVAVFGDGVGAIVGGGCIAILGMTGMIRSEVKP